MTGKERDGVEGAGGGPPGTRSISEKTKSQIPTACVLPWLLSANLPRARQHRNGSRKTSLHVSMSTKAVRLPGTHFGRLCFLTAPIRCSPPPPLEVVVERSFEGRVAICVGAEVGVATECSRTTRHSSCIDPNLNHNSDRPHSQLALLPPVHAGITRRRFLE